MRFRKGYDGFTFEVLTLASDLKIAETNIKVTTNLIANEVEYGSG